MLLASGQENGNEADIAGIRLEYLLTNATKNALGSTEGTCTITIAGSGTWYATATITWPDATTTVIPLLSEAHAGKFWASTRYECLEEMEVHDKTVGPAPLPITLQELADILDSFTGRTGVWLSETPSGRTWNPHPTFQENVAGLIDGPDYTLVGTLSNYLGAEVNAQIAATVFMPMAQNMNQYSRDITLARTALTLGLGDTDPAATAITSAEMAVATDGRGQTRYNPDPETGDAAVKFAFANHFGDHLVGERRFGSVTNQTATYQDTADNGLSPNPKWRMRMCLAMFLKDGTYTISGGGALIPYSYDPKREVGGEHHIRHRGQHAEGGPYLGGDGLYASWTAPARSGEARDANKQAHAMISPGVDFVQGPFSHAAHGWNFNEFSYLNGLYGNTAHGGFTVAGGGTQYANENQHGINVLPSTVYAVEVVSGVVRFYADGADDTSGNLITAPCWIYVTGISGAVGWDSGTNSDVNGWWPVTNIVVGADGDSPSGNGVRFDAVTTYPDEAKYTGTPTLASTAKLHLGRPKPTIPASTNEYLDAESGTWGFGSSVPGNKSFTPTLMGTVDDLRPGINPASHLLGPPGGYGYNEHDAGVGSTDTRDGLYRRQVQVVGGLGLSDYPLETQDEKAPTPTLTGGTGIRIPAQLGDSGQITERFSHANWANIDRSQWFIKGLTMSLWSAMDQTTGRHAWDYIKPEDSGGNTWPAGRNRPWPGRKRCGTWNTEVPSMIPMKGTYNDSTLLTYDTDPLAFIASDEYGLTEWATSPVYADIEIKAYIPAEMDRVTKIWFERGSITRGVQGLRSFIHHGRSHITHSSSTDEEEGWGHYPVGPSTANTVDGKLRRYKSNEYTHAETWWWAWGGSSVFENANIKAALLADDVLLPLDGIRSGWGLAANHIGSGGSETTFKEGLYTLRFAFHDGGMYHSENGNTKGTDTSSQGPTYGFTFEHGAFHTSDTDVTKSIWSNLYNKEGVDPIIDTVSVREIPTQAMLPFTAETITYDIADVIKYRTLIITGGGMGSTQTVRVSICAPGTTVGTWTEFGQAPGTPYTNFESLDPDWSGSTGIISLLDLPAAAYTDGFTIRFEWSTYTNEDTDYMPISWNSMPKIEGWVIDYDLTPTASLIVTAETFNGDTTSPIDTRVGHIVSYRVTGTTADTERLITHLKIDYGDGTVTDWLAVTSEALSAYLDINHSYATAAAGLLVRAKSKDNNGNESDWSPTITVNVANAPPVAILRATPSVARAGDAVRLDGSKSFDVEDGGTVTNFYFTPGDGSSIVGPQPTNYIAHTYAAAGEFMASMTCEDATGSTSNTAQAVIKVMPARLTVPLSLNTAPNAFERSRSAEYTTTSLIDSDYPEISDTGQRLDDFILSGVFLRETADADIAFMEDLLATGHLVEFEYQAVNYSGTPDSKTFAGRITTFNYQREGGAHGMTPWTATLVHEAGVGE